ncbi:recombinase family protein [Actinacidiphila acididurans]|uniref:Recombinase family protein n=1 Tax=Actinacidiphila acididurans TaxID=2784346 RepID=A0ABS2TQW9_9ACTN|nr:recombinase family protein [Actinacidiphila acididurans]MBM9505734.1 recombinase family protein [Actinacidiphila acididurans]
MKATSTWQIAREFTHADRHSDHRCAPDTAPLGAAPADNATPPGSAAEGVRERAAAGRQSGGHRRFGWLAGDLTGGRPHNHLLDPAESPYLRGAIEMIMAGKSEQTVSRWLAEQGVPTVRGGIWTGTTVRNMVSNPAVCGYRILGGELVRDPATGEPVVGGWETIATPQEWLRVMRRYERGRTPGAAKRAANASDASGGPDAPGTSGVSGASGPSGPSGARGKGPQGRKYVLSGFLRCGRPGADGRECGATLVGNPVTRGTPHGSYACASGSCRGLARRMDLVDATITAMVLDELERRYGSGPGEPGTWPDPLLGGFTRQRWTEFDLRQKRIAISAVIERVVVRPLPEGRSTRAPFDPALLDVRWTPRPAPEE